MWTQTVTSACCMLLAWHGLVASPAMAQAINGAITGTVRDESGAVMADVNVQVRSSATGLERMTTTAGNGTFRLAALPFGTYDLTARRQGFSTAAIQGIDVSVDQVRAVALVMRVSGTEETVTVVGRVALADTETSRRGEVIDNTKILGLPLNGRNFAQLATLSPGVAASGGGGGQQGGEGGVSGFSSNGQRSTSNNFLVDGIDNNNYLAGAVAQLPSVESIQEFEVQTNTFAAEYGRNSGAIINLITRSGTNDLRGSAFEFVRNDAFDARNFFDNRSFPKPPLRLNQFGATLGGPIAKDRTFFFANYEGFRRRAGITRLTNVPTLDERQGIFTGPDGQRRQVAVHPVSARLFNLFPLPNVSGPSGNFVSSPKLSQDTDQFLVKIDHERGGGNRLFGRYSYSHLDTVAPFTPGQGGTTIPGFGILTDGGTQLLSFGHTGIIGPRALNELRFGFTRATASNVNEAGAQAADFGFNTGHTPGSPRNLGNIPNITFSGGFVSGGGRLSNLGGTINNPSGAEQQTFQFIDTFSYTTARHAFKLGGEVRRIHLDRRFDLAFSGQIIFSGSQNSLGLSNPLIDFAEGRPSGSLQFVGDSLRELRTTSYGAFAQDSFKVRPNLALNYGVRYELNTVLRDAGGRLSTFRPDRFQRFLSPSASQTDLAALGAAGVVTQDEVGGIYDGDHNNVAPRVGVVYTIGDAARTVVRGGYGVFYDTIIGNIPGNVMLNPPFLPAFFIPATFVQFPAAFGPAAFPVLTVTEQDYPTPYAQHYNVGLQRELPWTMLVEAAYVGSKGSHLPRFRQINQAFITRAEIDRLTPSVIDRMLLMGIPPPAVSFLNTRIDLIPPIARNTYFGFAQIFQAENSVTSRYDSLQLKLAKRYSDGLSFLLSYTWSKSIDSASVFFGSGANGTTIFPQDNFNAVNGERGLSDFDIRHRLVWSYVYELPLNRVMPALPAALAEGWQIGGLLTLQTGQPFSVLTGSDNSRTGLGNDRPDLVGDPNAGPRTVEQFFNTAAFRPNALLTFGDAGRNIVTGPGYRNFDLSIIKNTRVGSRFTAQLRAEVFNVFNRPHFALPSNVLGAANFGALFQTMDVAQNNVGLGSGGPRLIQFGVKLLF